MSALQRQESSKREMGEPKNRPESRPLQQRNRGRRRKTAPTKAGKTGNQPLPASGQAEGKAQQRRERAKPKRARYIVPLQDGMNRRIDGDVGYFFLADEVVGALGEGKMQEAADMVVLVETGKQISRFLGAQSKRGKRHRIIETSRQCGIAVDDFLQVHHWHAGQNIERIPQGRFAPRAESQGLHWPIGRRGLMSEPFGAQDRLKLRPPKEKFQKRPEGRPVQKLVKPGHAGV